MEQQRQRRSSRRQEAETLEDQFATTTRVAPLEAARFADEVTERSLYAETTARNLDDVFAEMDALVSDDPAEFVIRFEQTIGQ